MRYRRHGWPGILEMCAAMYLPGLLLPFVVSGTMTAMTFMVTSHVAMPVLMLVVLLRRRAEFGGAAPLRSRQTTTPRVIELRLPVRPAPRHAERRRWLDDVIARIQALDDLTLKKAQGRRP